MVLAQGYVVTAYLGDGTGLRVYVHCTCSATYLGDGSGFRLGSLCSGNIF